MARTKATNKEKHIQNDMTWHPWPLPEFNPVIWWLLRGSIPKQNHLYLDSMKKYWKELACLKYTNQSINQSINQTINQSIKQTIKQSFNESIDPLSVSTFHDEGSNKLEQKHHPATPQDPLLKKNNESNLCLNYYLAKKHKYHYSIISSSSFFIS